MITSDQEQLRESIGISAERQSAVELARKVESTNAVHRLPELRLEHNLESARDWALWQAAAGHTIEPLPHGLNEKLEQKHQVQVQPVQVQQVEVQQKKERQQEKTHGHDIGFGF